MSPGVVFAVVRGQDLGSVRGQPIRPILTGFSEPITDWLFQTAMHARQAESAFFIRAGKHWAYGPGWLLVFALRWLGKARRLSVPDALAICFAQESGEIKLLSTGDTMVLAESAERPNLPPPRLPDERVAAARKAAQHMLKNFAANRGAPARSTANISLLLVAAVSPPESKK